MREVPMPGRQSQTAINPLLHHPYWAVVNLRRDFRELWLHRELLFTLTRREIVSRYKQTFFGLGWSLLQPIL